MRYRLETDRQTDRQRSLRNRVPFLPKGYGTLKNWLLFYLMGLTHNWRNGSELIGLLMPSGITDAMLCFTLFQVGAQQISLLITFLAYLVIALINAYIYCYLGNELIIQVSIHIICQGHGNR